MNIVLATNNKHKADEIIKIIGIEDYRIYLQNEMLEFPIEIEETGNTLEENAFIKAITLYNIIGMPTLADDTGLEIDILNGAPGVYSARYSGDNANDSENRAKILDEMKIQSVRTAQFRSVLCFHDGVRTLFAEGICKGEIISTERGLGGFGYDSIFLPQGESDTFAEMTPDAKNEISHRRKALNEMRIIFEKYR